MELYKRIELDFSFYDERGMIAQLVHEGYEQVNVLVTRSGVVRGKHYHKKTAETFYVVDGKVTVDFERDDNCVTVTFEKGDFFCVLPLVRHTMHFVLDTILVALYEYRIEQENGEKDIFAD